MTENGQPKGNTDLRYWLLLLGGVIALLWGIFGKEPCLIVLGIVAGATGLVLLGYLHGIYKSGGDDTGQ